jgi:PH domain
LILFSNRLEYIDPLYNRKKGDIGLNILCKAILRDSYTFELLTQKRVFVFKTESEGLASEWCSRINLVTEYLKKD